MAFERCLSNWAIAAGDTRVPGIQALRKGQVAGLGEPDKPLP